MISLSVSALVLLISIKCLRQQDLRNLLQDAGVALNKIAKTAAEIERKVFHLCGLLVPLIHQILLHFGWSQRTCGTIVWSITIVGFTSDLARVHIPFVQRN